MMLIRKVLTESGVIEYCLTRKAIKNINLRVKSDGKIEVSCPQRASDKTIDDFVISRSEWIAKALLRQSARTGDSVKFDYDNNDVIYYLGKEFLIQIMYSKRNIVKIKDGLMIVAVKDVADKSLIAKVLLKWYVLQANEILPNIFEHLAKAHCDRVGSNFTLKLTNSKSKWGSCTPCKRVIMLSRRLVLFSPECARYVVLHELSHMIESNHSPSFYAVLSSILPNYKEDRKALKELKIRSVVDVLFSKKYNN